MSHVKSVDQCRKITFHRGVFVDRENRFIVGGIRKCFHLFRVVDVAVVNGIPDHAVSRVDTGEYLHLLQVDLFADQLDEQLFCLPADNHGLWFITNVRQQETFYRYPGTQAELAVDVGGAARIAVVDNDVDKGKGLFRLEIDHFAGYGECLLSGAAGGKYQAKQQGCQYAVAHRTIFFQR